MRGVKPIMAIKFAMATSLILIIVNLMKQLKLRAILAQMDAFEKQHGYDDRGFCGMLEGGECYLFLRLNKKGNIRGSAPTACCIIRKGHITFYEGDEARQLLQKYRIGFNSILF